LAGGQTPTAGLRQQISSDYMYETMRRRRPSAMKPRKKKKNK
jgi:hypothetical protein